MNEDDDDDAGGSCDEVAQPSFNDKLNILDFLPASCAAAVDTAAVAVAASAGDVSPARPRPGR